MRLYALKLSQPTVFAFTFLLLIVMNLEQVRSNEEKKFLYHSDSHRFLTMHANGSVTTDAGRTNNQCMVLSSMSPTNQPLKLSIYNPATKMFLCFNKTRTLVGKRVADKSCYFYESFNDLSYILFQQAPVKARQTQNQKPRFVAFTKDGRPQKLHRKKMKAAQFMKMNPKQGECTDYPNETYVPIRHSKHNRRRHKP